MDYEKKYEDEQHRKWILEYLYDGLRKSDEQFKGQFKAAIAWLKKQESLTIDEEKQGKEDVLWCIKQAKKYAKDENEMGTCWFAEQWLEKQGNKLKEKKTDNANKAEPKFKVGDWIVNQHGTVRHIEEVGNVGYQTDGGWLERDYYEKNFRLWSIADAKGGDVLYLQKDGKEHIIIYKGVIKERFRTFVSAYCAYNGIVDAFCFADVSRYADIAYGGIMPATKEQRDTLIKAMTDAGYTFDFDKKELKKIEAPLPSFFDEAQGTPVIDIPFGAKDSELQEASYHIPEGFYAEIQDDKVVIKKGKNLSWSEEDEMRFNSCLEILSQSSYGKIETDNTVWLKSIKQRAAWKPSDNELEVLRLVAEKDGTCLMGLYEQLKKLRGE